MAKIVPLFSSSRGNSYYIQGNDKAILIDAGRNCRQIETALEKNGLSMENVGAVFVSHEHSDHVSALKVLLKKYPRPVFATEGTLEELILSDRLPAGIQTHVLSDVVSHSDFEVTRVKTSHDARASCGFFITTPDRRKCAVVTDTGFLTDEAKSAISKSGLAVIESNHDVSMLRSGGYPYPLKKRILSDVGHLSNAACAAALPAFVSAGLTRIILAHLSPENNTPRLALDEAVRSLESAGMTCGIDYLIDAAAADSYGKAMVF